MPGSVSVPSQSSIPQLTPLTRGRLWQPTVVAGQQPSAWLWTHKSRNYREATVSQKANPLVAQTVKNLPAVQEVWFLDQEDPLEEGMATHSSILAWRIPWTEEPGKLQSMGSQRVRHNWATNDFTFTFCNSALVADMFGFLRLSASSTLSLPVPGIRLAG